MSSKSLNTDTDLVRTFEVYGNSVYRYIYMRVGYRTALAEDLTQDVFEKAWRKRSTYDSRKANLKNWIFAIARNTLTDHYRKSKKEDPMPEGFEGGSEKGNPELKTEVWDVYEKMEELSDFDKELIILRYVESWSIDEIAQLIKKRRSATKVAVHRAIKRLKGLLNEE